MVYRPIFASRKRAQAFGAGALLSLLLSACVSGPAIPPGKRLSSAPPKRGQRAATPAGNGRVALSDFDSRQCMANLSRAQIQFTALPDRDYGGGCGAINSVKLLDIGTPVTNLGSMTCPLAAKFAAWARYGVQPAARLVLGQEITRIETFGTYNCRPIAGSGKLSEHAHANAVDVAAFVLADGTRISVKGDWDSGGRAARFLKVIHDSACKRFSTVLSPDYNSAHHDHFHFDMGSGRMFCS